MRICSFLLGVVFLIGSCTTLPKAHHPEALQTGAVFVDCRKLFPAGRWQFQHVIAATFPGGKKSVLMGVSVISGDTGSIRCVLMTVEGMVVFDAEHNRKLKVRRAIPPFDTENFAKGLIGDIRLIFFVPAGAMADSGTLGDGASVCRYRLPQNRFVDIVRHSEQHWEILEYDYRFKKQRTVEFFFSDGEIDSDRFRAPGRLKLTSLVYPGYTLDLDLVEAVWLEGPR